MARYRSTRTGVEMTVGDKLPVGLGDEWVSVESKSAPKPSTTKRAPRKAPAKKSDN